MCIEEVEQLLHHRRTVVGVGIGFPQEQGHAQARLLAGIHDMAGRTGNIPPVLGRSPHNHRHRPVFDGSAGGFFKGYAFGYPEVI